MRFKDIYYKLGGKKGSFLQRQWSRYVSFKLERQQRLLLQRNGLDALKAMGAACEEMGVSFGLEFGTMLPPTGRQDPQYCCWRHSRRRTG